MRLQAMVIKVLRRGAGVQKEECHLSKVLKQNGYPSAFILSSSLPSGRVVETIEASPMREGRRSPLVMLPMEGVSEDIRQVCRKFGMKVVFRSGRSLRSMLTKVKDALTKGEAVQGGVPGPLQLW